MTWGICTAVFKIYAFNVLTALLLLTFVNNDLCDFSFVKRYIYWPYYDITKKILYIYCKRILDHTRHWKSDKNNRLQKLRLAKKYSTPRRSRREEPRSRNYLAASIHVHARINIPRIVPSSFSEISPLISIHVFSLSLSLSLFLSPTLSLSLSHRLCTKRTFDSLTRFTQVLFTEHIRGSTGTISPPFPRPPLLLTSLYISMYMFFVSLSLIAFISAVLFFLLYTNTTVYPHRYMFLLPDHMNSSFISFFFFFLI